MVVVLGLCGEWTRVLAVVRTRQVAAGGCVSEGEFGDLDPHPPLTVERRPLPDRERLLEADVRGEKSAES